MIRVGIVGLKSLHNFGENFLINCTEYLVKQNKDVSIQIIDAEVENDFLHSHRFLRRVAYSLQHRLRKIKLVCIPLYKLIYGRNLKSEVQKQDAIILAFGSFKYGTQKLWLNYSLIVRYAFKKNIPVLFNGMNIQKYDGNNWHCLYLKKHLNYPNVKMITTRDGQKGIVRLKNDFITNPQLKYYDVGDLGLYIDDVYKIQKTKSEVVGINLLKKKSLCDIRGGGVQVN